MKEERRLRTEWRRGIQELGKWRHREDPSRESLCVSQEGLWRWTMQEPGTKLLSLRAGNAQSEDEGMETALRSKRGMEAVRTSGQTKPCALLRTGRCKPRSQAGKPEKSLHWSVRLV